MDPELDEDEAKFCSACLASDVQLILLRKSGYSETFTTITGVSTMDRQRPLQYICYICLALLKRCARFRNMCLKAQQLFDRISADCGVIKKKHIVKLPHPKLTENYTFTALELTTYLPETAELAEVKAEDSAEFGQEYNHYVTKCVNHVCNHAVDRRMFVKKVQTDVIESVKLMDESDPDKVIDDLVYDLDLDKPLALLKTDMTEELLKDSKRKVLKISGKKVKRDVIEQIKLVPRRHPCGQCGANFQNLKWLYDHIAKEHHDTTLTCIDCDMEFTKQTTLHQHWIHAHRGKEKKKPKPEAKAERPLPKTSHLCYECGKQFKAPCFLRQHMMKHSGEKPFACDICDKRFRLEMTLRTHKFMHSGEKPFECALCSKRFRQSAHVRRHYRMHTGEKPYTCSLCHKKFSQPWNRDEHVRTVHEGLPPKPRPGKLRKRLQANKV